MLSFPDGCVGVGFDLLSAGMLCCRWGAICGVSAGCYVVLWYSALFCW